MRPDRTLLKKKLSNTAHFEALEIIGLSTIPLSKTQIERKYPTRQNSYCYTVIKDLDESGFLKISYEEKCESSKRHLSINHRYNLNLKGFLLYLFSAYRNNKIRSRTINRITENISRDDKNLRFLQDLNSLDDESKVNTLVNIALELQNQLKDITPEYMTNYMVRRCYTDIAEQEALSSIRDNPSTRLASRLVKKGGKYYFNPPTAAQLEDEERNEANTRKLWKFKLRILDDLIEIMEKDLDQVKKQKQFELEFPR